MSFYWTLDFISIRGLKPRWKNFTLNYSAKFPQTKNKNWFQIEWLVQSLHEKCPYSEFFWSLFSRIWTEYGKIRSPNAEKYGPEKLQIRTLFTQWMCFLKFSKAPHQVLYFSKLLLMTFFLFLKNRKFEIS